MTLSENARSGFEATSIWPLDRSKISNEKTGGTNYYNEATELPLSHYTSDYFASKKNQTKTNEKNTIIKKENNYVTMNLSVTLDGGIGDVWGTSVDTSLYPS
jgi:hypothetical protein